MHSPHRRSATSEKYMSESELDCISEHSLSETDMKEIGKYQQQFQAGRLSSPDERDMVDVMNLTSGHENVIYFVRNN